MAAELAKVQELLQCSELQLEEVNLQVQRAESREAVTTESLQEKIKDLEETRAESDK